MFLLVVMHFSLGLFAFLLIDVHFNMGLFKYELVAMCMSWRLAEYVKSVTGTNRRLCSCEMMIDASEWD